MKKNLTKTLIIAIVLTSITLLIHWPFSKEDSCYNCPDYLYTDSRGFPAPAIVVKNGGLVGYSNNISIVYSGLILNFVFYFICLFFFFRFREWILHKPGNNVFH